MVVVAKRILKAAVLGLAIVLGATGCATGFDGSTFDPNIYVVRPGDTLYAIAWRYQIDYQDLVRWNSLRNPDEIHPGQRIRLAPTGGRARTTATRSSASSTPASQSQRTARRAADDDGSNASRAPAARIGEWRWPTAGKVIGTFRNGKVAGRGVDIAGTEGQPVQATAAGEVVYSGAGLPAYGQLIIIRHANDYLSAYAHNSDRLVAEGKRVAAGQQIGRMGRSNDGTPLLHFEIRRRGQPVDPLEYLPARE